MDLLIFQLHEVSNLIDLDEYGNPPEKYRIPEFKWNTSSNLSEQLNKQIKQEIDMIDSIPTNSRYVYSSLFTADMEAFKAYKFNVDLYAVVLLYDGIYQGHVYAWIPWNNKNCCMMHIRKTLYQEHSSLKGKISDLLISGVKNLALVHNCVRIIIVSPYEWMEKKAERLGFHQISNLTSKDIGISPGISYERAKEFDMTDPSMILNLK